jgi:phosphohistidine phosphatase
MRLFLVRHAHAVDGTPDELRPLSDQGREQARELAARLAATLPDVVLSSPLLRARETADAIARASGAPLRVDDRLAPGASADSLLAAAGDAGGTVVAVGHQPDCSEIAVALTGGPDPGFAPAGYLEVEVSPDLPE